MPVIRKHFQIIYSIALIILIPLAIIFNSYYLTNSLKGAMDQELQWKALLAEDIFNVAIEKEITDLTIPAAAAEIQKIGMPTVDWSKQNFTSLQHKIEKLARANESIRAIDIMLPVVSENKELGFQIIASLDRDYIGKVSSSTANILAWQRDEPVAHLTVSRAATAQQRFVKKEDVSSERSWIVTKPLVNDKQTKVGLISLKLSLAPVDDLVDTTLFQSYVFLGLTLLVIILIVANNTRLFQYAVLFKKIKEVDQMKDEFISIASHELRTPVTGIKGYVSMLLEGTAGKLNPKAKKIITIIQDSANRLNSLVNDLLDVSRIEQERLTLDSKPTKTFSIVERIRDELSAEAERKGLKLILTKPERALPLINIDEDKFNQVMTNIIGNAIKYTLKGSVTIYTELVEGKLSFKVKDTGLGMDAQERAKLFEKFYRVKSVATANITGTGLGLWITKQLVELMGGEIYVDSIKGVGTEFTVSFLIIK